MWQPWFSEESWAQFHVPAVWISEVSRKNSMHWPTSIWTQLHLNSYTLWHYLRMTIRSRTEVSLIFAMHMWFSFTHLNLQVDVSPSSIEFDETLDITLPIGKLICDRRRHRGLSPAESITEEDTGLVRKWTWTNVACEKGRTKSFSWEHLFSKEWRTMGKCKFPESWW